jgi:hypothetical protein
MPEVYEKEESVKTLMASLPKERLVKKMMLPVPKHFELVRITSEESPQELVLEKIKREVTLEEEEPIEIEYEEIKKI